MLLMNLSTFKEGAKAFTCKVTVNYVVILRKSRVFVTSFEVFGKEDIREVEAITYGVPLKGRNLGNGRV